MLCDFAIFPAMNIYLAFTIYTAIPIYFGLQLLYMSYTSRLLIIEIKILTIVIDNDALIDI